jgi:hypothetical protein
MREHSAAAGAKSLLHSAARQLGTLDPVSQLGDVLDESLSRPAGDDAYRGHHTLEPLFSESAAGSLAFDLLPGGPWASPSDRVAMATDTARRLTERNFGSRARQWLDGHIDVASALGGRSSTWGASLRSGFGRDGALESALHMEWGPQLIDALPAPLHRVVRIVQATAPGLTPAVCTVSTTPRGGSQQVTFAVPRALPLARLQPLMRRLGLGHQHASLVSAVALLLGARYVLPPDSATITVGVNRSGARLRLDVHLDAIPDPPPELTRLLRLQMSERPRSLRAFHTWVAALTPEGYDGPGRLSVLSVIVGPDRPARLALHLSPAVLERPRRRRRRPIRDDEDDVWTVPRDEVPASAWLPAGASP